MKASALEFRLRVWIHAVIYALGFWAPWTMIKHKADLDVTLANAHVWGVLAAGMAPYLGAPTDPNNILTAFNVLLIVATVFALLGAGLRTWGAAYLGSDVVLDGAMSTQGRRGLLEDGPYRHLRNPLYLGTFVHTLALALLMSRSGAVFTIVAIGLVQVRLILGEEAYLSNKLGQVYADYRAQVPRLLPALRAKIAGTGAKARWGQAFLGELYFWGVAGSFAAMGWRYNANLLTQGVLVSFGVAVIVRAGMPGRVGAGG